MLTQSQVYKLRFFFSFFSTYEENSHTLFLLQKYKTLTALVSTGSYIQCPSWAPIAIITPCNTGLLSRHLAFIIRIGIFCLVRRQHTYHMATALRTHARVTQHLTSVATVSRHRWILTQFTIAGSNLHMPFSPQLCAHATACQHQLLASQKQRAEYCIRKPGYRHILSMQGPTRCVTTATS